MIWSRFALIALLATGCFGGGGTPDEDDYPEKLADQYCQFLSKCSSAQFYYDYGNVDDCTDALLDAQDEAGIDYGDCDYDEDNAKDCLSLYKMSCKDAAEEWDDLSETCAEVYDCGGSTDEEEDSE